MRRIWSMAVGLTFLIVALGIHAAPGPKGKDEKDDLKKLEGKWEVSSWEQLGRELDLKATWIFDGEKYALDMGSNFEEGTVKLDASKKVPTIDLTITGGNCKGNEQPGIYKVDGDKLTICLAWPGQTNRPTEFKSLEEERTILITLKRVK